MVQSYHANTERLLVTARKNHVQNGAKGVIGVSNHPRVDGSYDDQSFIRAVTTVSERSTVLMEEEDPNTICVDLGQ